MAPESGAHSPLQQSVTVFSTEAAPTYCREDVDRHRAPDDVLELDDHLLLAVVDRRPLRRGGRLVEDRAIVEHRRRAKSTLARVAGRSTTNDRYGVERIVLFAFVALLRSGDGGGFSAATFASTFSR
jgi:hypothetical protein